MSAEHRPSESRSRQLQRKIPNTEVYKRRKQYIPSLLISLVVRKGQITNVLVKWNINPDSSGCLASLSTPGWLAMHKGLRREWGWNCHTSAACGVAEECE